MAAVATFAYIDLPFMHNFLDSGPDHSLPSNKIHDINSVFCLLHDIQYLLRIFTIALVMTCPMNIAGYHQCTVNTVGTQRLVYYQPALLTGIARETFPLDGCFSGDTYTSQLLT